MQNPHIWEASSEGQLGRGLKCQYISIADSTHKLEFPEIAQAKTLEVSEQVIQVDGEKLGTEPNTIRGRKKLGPIKIGSIVPVCSYM